MPPHRRSADMDSILSNSSNETSTSIRSCATSTSYFTSYRKPPPEIPCGSFSCPPPATYAQTGPPLPIRQATMTAPEVRLPLMPTTPPRPTPIKRQVSRGVSLRRSHPHCYLRRRTLLLLSVVSVTLSIAAVTILTAMLLEQSKDKDYALFKDEREVCLKCIILKENPGEAQDDPLFKLLDNRQVKNELFCCAKTSQGLSALLQLMTRRLQNISIPESISSNHYKFSPASAHVTFKETAIPSPNSNTTVVKLNNVTNEDRSHSMHAREVKVSESSIQIQHTGWYYVYSSVYFNSPSGKACRELKFQTWMNYIMRKSVNRPDQSGCLVKAAHTCCQNCVRDHHTSFTGGIFFLEKGDYIYVETSGDGVILFEEKASYFGLVMLGTNKPEERIGG